MKQGRTTRTGDEQIEPAVVVVIQEGCDSAGAQPLRLGQPARAIIVPQNSPYRSRHDDVERAIVVVIAYRHGVGPWTSSHTRVGKPLHTIVVKHRVTAIRAGDEDVGASVVVEIAEGRVAAAPRDPIGIRERGE